LFIQTWGYSYRGGKKEEKKNKNKIYLYPTLYVTETKYMSHYEFNAVPYKSGIAVSGTSHNFVRIPYHADLNM